MTSTTPDVDAALEAAAAALPSHFTDGEGLDIQVLDPIQATTMSLPGGAYAVESVLKEAGNVGTVVLIITGLVDHANGEVFSRDEARTLWSAALTDALTALGEGLGEFTQGQLHMTDAFDAIEKADEANVVGLFKGDTLACLLVALPAKATGEGAAAQLAAAVAAAEAEAAGVDAEEEPEGDAEAEGEDAVDAEDAGAGEASEAPAQDPAAAAGAPGMMPGMQGMPGMAGMPGMMPGMAPGAPMTPEAAAAYQAQVEAAQAAQRAAYDAAVAANPLPTPQFQPLAGAMMYAVDPRRIDLLRDVIMGVSVELGRTRLTVQEILGLTPGSIVELDRAAGAPVDVLVNGTLIAHGEVVVVDEEFAVRISEVVSPDPQGRIGA